MNAEYILLSNTWHAGYNAIIVPSYCNACCTVSNIIYLTTLLTIVTTVINPMKLSRPKALWDINTQCDVTHYNIHEHTHHQKHKRHNDPFPEPFFIHIFTANHDGRHVGWHSREMSSSQRIHSQIQGPVLCPMILCIQVLMCNAFREIHTFNQNVKSFSNHIKLYKIVNVTDYWKQILTLV